MPETFNSAVTFTANETRLIVPIGSPFGPDGYLVRVTGNEWTGSVTLKVNQAPPGSAQNLVNVGYQNLNTRTDVAAGTAITGDFWAIVPATGYDLFAVVVVSVGAVTLNISPAEGLPDSGSSTIGFIQLGTGAVERTVQDKLRENVSAVDFGADPTGVTDSRTAIQNALDAHDVVFLPAGTFLVSGTLDIPAGRTLNGESSQDSIIKLMDNAYDAFAGTGTVTITAGAAVFSADQDVDLSEPTGTTVGRIFTVDQAGTGTATVTGTNVITFSLDQDGILDVGDVVTIGGVEYPILNRTNGTIWATNGANVGPLAFDIVKHYTITARTNGTTFTVTPSDVDQTAEAFTITYKSVPIIKVERTRVTLRDFTVNGNNLNNEAGYGIDAENTASDPAHYLTIADVFVSRAAEVGIAMRNSNASSLRNVSVGRCPTALTVARSRAMHLSNMVLEKFTYAGLVIQGGVAPIVMTWTTGFMETSVNTPMAQAPFIHYENATAGDCVTLTGVYMYGHDTDESFDTTGVTFDNPIYMDQFTMRGCAMRDVTTFYRVINEGASPDTRYGFNDISGVTRTGATPEPTRNLGIFTENSYRFVEQTDVIDLATAGVVTVLGIPNGAPMELTGFDMLCTTELDGAGDGTLRVSFPGVLAHWATVTLTEGTLANTMTSLLSGFTRTKSITTGTDILTLNPNTPLSVGGAARFLVRGIVY